MTLGAKMTLAGDAGDGIQWLGKALSSAMAAAGYQPRFIPQYPAEIRSPRGTDEGVSLVALAGLGTPAGVVVVMSAAAARVLSAPIATAAVVIHAEDVSLSPECSARRLSVPLQTLARESGAAHGLTGRAADRNRNGVLLGVLCTLLGLDVPTGSLGLPTHAVEGARAAIAAGEVFVERSGWPTMTIVETAGEPVQLITGARALALGLEAIAKAANRAIFVGTYPITPASAVVESLEGAAGIQVVQAEDEIAAAGMAIGASLGGQLGVVITSGPGMSLISEMLGFAVMAEVPLVVINVQRAGPSTGMPTMTAQSDLNLALYGRHGDAPMMVVSPATAADCVDLTALAAQSAVAHQMPVCLLADALLVNEVRPWDPGVLKGRPEFSERQWSGLPLTRDAETLALPPVDFGRPDGERVISSLEQTDGWGAISYLPENHRRMVAIRRDKVDRVRVPDAVIEGSGARCVLSWGSTYSRVREAIGRCESDCAHIHLRTIHPLPTNLAGLTAAIADLWVVEQADGQLAMRLQAVLGRHVHSWTDSTGRPLDVERLVADLEAS